MIPKTNTTLNLKKKKKHDFTFKTGKTNELEIRNKAIFCKCKDVGQFPELDHERKETPCKTLRKGGCPHNLFAILI